MNHWLFFVIGVTAGACFALIGVARYVSDKTGEFQIRVSSILSEIARFERLFLQMQREVEILKKDYARRSHATLTFLKKDPPSEDSH